MNKFFIAAMCLVMALSSTSCTNASAQIDAPQSHNDVGVYIVSDSEYEIITKCVQYSLGCEEMYNDLKAYNVELLINVCNPSHDCLECQLKALKFFYNHDAYVDTTGETDEAEDFEEILYNNEQLRALWETIKI